MSINSEKNNNHHSRSNLKLMLNPEMVLNWPDIDKMIDDLPDSVVNYLVMKVTPQKTWFNQITFAISCLDQSSPTPLYNKLVVLNNFFQKVVPQSALDLPFIIPENECVKQYIENGYNFINLVCYYKNAVEAVNNYLDDIEKEFAQKLSYFKLPPFRTSDELWYFEKKIKSSSKKKKKIQTDPIVQNLTELLCISKLRTDWMLKFSQNLIGIKQQILNGQLQPPFQFELLGWDLKTTITFIVWDRRAWVLNHSSEYSENAKYHTPPNGIDIFLQFNGDLPPDSWFLRTIKMGGLQTAHTNAKNQFLKDIKISSRLQCGHNTQGIIIPNRGMGQLLASVRKHMPETLKNSSIVFDPIPLVSAAIIGNLVIQAICFCGIRISELQEVTLNKECIRLEKVEYRERNDSQIKIDSYYTWNFFAKQHDNVEKVYVYPTVMETLATFIEVYKDFHNGNLPGNVICAKQFSLSRLYKDPLPFVLQWNGNHLGSSLINACIEFVLLDHFVCDENGSPVRINASSLRHGFAGYLHSHGIATEIIGQALHQRYYEVTSHYGHIPDDNVHEHITPLTHDLGELVDLENRTNNNIIFRDDNQISDCASKPFIRVTGGWCKKKTGCQWLEKCPSCPNYRFVPNRIDEVADRVGSCVKAAINCTDNKMYLDARYWESIANKWSFVQKFCEEVAPVLQLEISTEPLQKILPPEKFNAQVIEFDKDGKKLNVGNDNKKIQILD
ncbi:MAG: hypothetical protein CVU43_02450 [Chloroflexi bacterium HGW-Chloroflexi-5]|jgi:hypothetical protein|nr:MAG: hypothetical protein CVU43_02450 [Chloroflexi bacterium HGW-Chloroflexi-5]